MKRIGLMIVALVLGLVACSTPDLANSPQVSVQFGTAEDDIGVDVATVSTDRIYSLGSENYSVDNEEFYGYVRNAVLRRYNSSGNLVWSKYAFTSSCNYYLLEEDCESIGIKAFSANTQGYTYVMYSNSVTRGDCLPVYETYVNKLDATGEVVRTYNVGDTGGSVMFSGDYITNTDMAVDSNGNLYVGAENGNVDTGECTTTDKSVSISKISSNAALLWRRTSTVGGTTDIVYAPSGNLYVAGTKGLAKYTSSGNLVWTKAIGPLENVVVSGSSVYTRYRKDIRKFDGNGKQLWLKTQSGLNTLIGQDISGDTSGNVYLSGKYNAGSGNYSPFVRKLNSSGTVLWTKTYGTPAYDDALGIATITGSEIYVTGETQGSLSHTNIGGRDGYLRKLNSSGTLVWSK